MTSGGESLLGRRSTARRIYVASSWRNPIQPELVGDLRRAGHQVYDFRNPRPGDHGFAWSEIDPDWLAWRPEPFRDALGHPVAVEGYLSDFKAMQWADTFVLALPCGRSAHLEAGWAIGRHKPTAILLHEEKFEPELMYRMADLLAIDTQEVIDWLLTLACICPVSPPNGAAAPDPKCPQHGRCSTMPDSSNRATLHNRKGSNEHN